MRTAPSTGWRLWLAGARPKTLPAALVPVAIGTAAAVGHGEGGVIWWRAGAALVVALALQVATNYVNDHADGVRGTDAERVGPQRLVGSGLAPASAVKRAAIIAFGVAAVAGAALAAAVGWELLVVGAASMVAGWAYTGGPRPYGYLGLGEVFVFVFFGLVATLGSTWVQIEQLPWVAWAAAVVAGAWATALLVINNLRDLPTDARAAKRTLAVRVGDRRTRQAYAGLIGLAAAAVVVVAFDRPPALLGLVGVLAAVGPVRRVLGGADAPELIGVLGSTARAQLLGGLALALGLAMGA